MFFTSYFGFPGILSLSMLVKLNISRLKIAQGVVWRKRKDSPADAGARFIPPLKGWAFSCGVL